MSLLIAALLATASDGPQYPVADVLDAARSVCDVVLANDDPAALVIAAGWISYTPKAGSGMEQSLREEKEIYGSSSRVFAKMVAGRAIFAFVNSVQTKDGHLRLCMAEDNLAEIQSAPEQIIHWAGRSPFDNGIHLPGDLQKGFDDLSFMRSWKPGLNQSANDTVIRYLPRKYGGSKGGLSYTSERLVEVSSQ